jgi:putative membrane protein
MEILLRYLHFISVITLSGTLIAEFFLLKSSLEKKEIRLLGQIDAVYGISALILLGVGLTLWLGGYGKPTEFYSENPTFHLKLGLFVLIGLISIYPTIFFIKNGKGEDNEIIKIPSLVHWSLRAELILLALIPLFAGLMAKGIRIF